MWDRGLLAYLESERIRHRTQAPISDEDKDPQKDFLLSLCRATATRLIYVARRKQHSPCGLILIRHDSFRNGRKNLLFTSGTSDFVPLAEQPKYFYYRKDHFGYGPNKS